MEIGERVRLLHSKEEGIIRRFIDNRTLEIEIEEGFLVPILKNEVVKIAGEESERFKKEQKEYSEDKLARPGPTHEGQPEVLLALEHNGTEIVIWLINNTPDLLLFTAHNQFPNQIKGISQGKSEKYTYVKIASWDLKNQGQWPLLCIDGIFFIREGRFHRSILSRKINIGKNHLQKKPAPTPLLNKNTITVSLLEEVKDPDPVSIKKAFFSSKQTETKDPGRIKEKDDTVDLHAESIIRDPSELSNSEILNLQLDHFEKRLEQAVINNLNSITFIHGVGNGTLRHLIHKNLSQYPHIRYFEDVMKEKFGYGATKVYLK